MPVSSKAVYFVVTTLTAISRPRFHFEAFDICPLCFSASMAKADILLVSIFVAAS